MIRIKICGMTNEEDIHLCASAGVDALGFVVEYPVAVPWNLERKLARRLMDHVPPFVTRVIVVGDDLEEVLAITDTVKPHVVQLHGREPFAVTKELLRRLKSRGVEVIKALRFALSGGILAYDIAEPVEACHRLADAGVSAVVLDAFTDSRPAGTGKTLDWTIARSIRDTVRIPLILAGGLKAENVREAIATVQPYGVDVITGVEKVVCRKDPCRVRAFIRAVRSA